MESLNLTQELIESITQLEYLRGTDRFLPKPEDIPLEHWGWFKGVTNNIYFRIAEAMYVGEPPPSGKVVINTGFTGKGMKQFLMAHLVYMEPEYQHRVAGVAYMMTQIVTVTEVKDEPTD